MMERPTDCPPTERVLFVAEGWSRLRTCWNRRRQLRHQGALGAVLVSTNSRHCERTAALLPLADWSTW